MPHASSGPTKWFAHVDMDAFYAAVEVLDFPELAGKPVAVGGSPEGRGVIAAASYEARRYGVHSAQPTARALRLCPHLVLRPGRMGRYQDKSREVMRILEDASPRVEPLSLDEAFLDLTGCDRLHGPWPTFALTLRRRIREQTGLWASIGMGETRRIAKIASDLRKPRGLVVVEAGAGPRFLAPLPVGRLWGVGPKLRQRLEVHGFRTAADLAATPRATLQSMFGKMGPALHDMVHAREGGRVDPGRRARSVSHEVTFPRNKRGLEQLEPTLMGLSANVARRLRRGGLLGRVVFLKIRDHQFTTVTRRITLPEPSDSEETLYRWARHLLTQLRWENVPVRLIGVGMSGLSKTEGRQGDLFHGDHDREQRSLEDVLDRVHERFGGRLERARTLLRTESAAWIQDERRPLRFRGAARPRLDREVDDGNE